MCCFLLKTLGTILIASIFCLLLITAMVQDFRQNYVWDPELQQHIKVEVALMRQILKNAQQNN